ncbi:unnamed protein product [Mytilus edulis]|uniref:Uncharacterized protein n=1 Tax=Mytilus edulis TaxID=6550 RepID=A0A8S3VMH3_MYTED|nr:unnamed protein product [Mytilus edulis]
MESQITVKRTRHKVLSNYTAATKPSVKHSKREHDTKCCQILHTAATWRAFTSNYSKENTIQSVVRYYIRLRHGEPSRQITVKNTIQSVVTSNSSNYSKENTSQSVVIYYIRLRHGEPSSNYSKENTIQSVVRYYIRLRHGEPSRQITVKRTRHKVLSDITYGCDMESLHVKLQ